MTHVQKTAPNPQKSLHFKGANTRGLVLSMIIDAGIPYIVYMLTAPYFSKESIIPLLLASIAPAIENVVSIIRQRRLDYLGVIVILSLVFGIITSLITGNQKLLLIRESFFTGGFGFVCLISLFFPRPLLFFIGRHFATGNDPERIAYFDSLWQYAGFRFTQRLITVVWGIGLLLEFVIRIVLIETLSTEQVLFFSPLILTAITFLLIFWTFAYARRRARLAQQRNSN